MKNEVKRIKEYLKFFRYTLIEVIRQHIFSQTTKIEYPSLELIRVDSVDRKVLILMNKVNRFFPESQSDTKVRAT